MYAIRAATSRRRMERCGCATLQTNAGPLYRIVILLSLLFAPCISFAQGITTGSLRGIVEDAHGTPLDAAIARTVETSSGFAIKSSVHNGRFVAQGLAAGGPYSVLVTKIGYAPQRVDGLYVPLGGESTVRVTLHPIATQLDTIRVSAKDGAGGGSFTGG